MVARARYHRSPRPDEPLFSLKLKLALAQKFKSAARVLWRYLSFKTLANEPSEKLREGYDVLARFECGHVGISSFHRQSSIQADLLRAIHRPSRNTQSFSAHVAHTTAAW